ncbi:MAG: phosphatase PAP2 family protein [Xanthobacteraceae bacterium]|nr:phosphatase PAP2 family protein [Xanthobacteraceae bacterium]
MSAAAQAQATSPLGAAASQQLITRDPAKLTFPREYWDPEHRAYLPIVELLQGDWDKRIKIDPPPSGQAQLLEEIRYLHSLIGQREQRREEIVAQHTSPILPYFFPMLLMNQTSHRRTFELMSFTNSMGLIVNVYKHRFNRARPAQLSPSLMPMITTPGHPAYPSGHGFQSWLGAIALAEVRPDARPALIAMAQRIGHNREIAGVHYPSDTKAGQMLADQVLAIAKEGKLFQELLAEAKAEWR